MGYVAYMKHGYKFIKVVTQAEFELRRSQGWKMALKSEYEKSQLAPAATPQPNPVTDATAGDAGDSGYSELLDELSGKIKRLERENKILMSALFEIRALGNHWSHGELSEATAITRTYKIAADAIQFQSATPAAAGSESEAGE